MTLTAVSTAAAFRVPILHDPAPLSRPTVISLFAGAGGTALGFDHAGFDHVLLSEIDNDAVATLAANRPEWTVTHGDVTDIDFTPFYDQVDVVEGGFPCQAFSYAGNRQGLADTRGTMFFEFSRAIAQVMPKVFVGENVRGLLSHDKGRTIATMLDELSAIQDPSTGASYRIGYRIVKSQDHFVPQNRLRVIIVGVRSDVGDTTFFPKDQQQLYTLEDAIGDRPQGDGQAYSEAKHAVLDMVPAGGHWRDLPDNIAKSYLGKAYYGSGGRTSIARRLAWTKASPTLTCSPAQKQTELCHPDETRPLNVREYARIQTFPDNWHFAGGIGSQYRQIGNAVPVNLGFFLAQAVRAMLGETEPIDSGYVEQATPTHLYTGAPDTVGT